MLIDCTAPYELGIVTNAKSDIDADADTANLVLSRGKFHVLVNSSIFSLLNLLIKVCFLFSYSFRIVSGMDTNSMLRINLVKYLPKNYSSKLNYIIIINKKHVYKYFRYTFLSNHHKSSCGLFLASYPLIDRFR